MDIWVIDAVDRVDTYRKFGFESRYITARFADDKLLSYKRVEAVGITNGRLQDVHHRDLDRMVLFYMPSSMTNLVE